MNIADALLNVTRLFLDTAPIIYFVEQNPHYYAIAKRFFDQIDVSSQKVGAFVGQT